MHRHPQWAQSFRILLTPLTYITVRQIDIESCEQCQGPVKVIACVEDPMAIRQILDHLKSKEATEKQTRLPPGRALPQLKMFK